MSVIEACRPVSHGLVDGVLQSPGAGPDRYDFCAHQLHPVDIHLLPLDVHFAHVDLRLKTQIGPDDGRGHTMLARSGLGDQPGFAHILRHQRLTEGVVELMSSAVYQILSFQIDPTIQLSTEIPGKIEGRWPSREVLLE